MAALTLYEILEVSETAQPEAIRAAYERLAKLYDPSSPHHYAVADGAIRQKAVKEAFLTLGNPHKREAYDRKLAGQWKAAVPKRFWTLPKVVFVAALVASIGGGYLHHRAKQEEARVAAEAKQRQQVEDAIQATAAHARMELAQARARLVDERQRRERDASLARFQNEQHFHATRSHPKDRPE